jgi:LMBR1 domain-containing protein 1
MELLWNIVFWAIPVWVFVLIPFSTFYYEADDGMLMAGTAYAPNPIKRSRFRQALCYQPFVFIIIGLVFLVTYILLADTKIPVQQYEGTPIGRIGQGSQAQTYRYNIPPVTGVNATFDVTNLPGTQPRDLLYVADNTGSEDIELQVGVSTFYAGLMAWFGWFLFAVFGGIGLAALPLDLILAFVNRPRHMDAVEFAEAQMSLRERVNELVDIGELIKVEREQKAQTGMTSTMGAWSFNSEIRKAAKDESQAIKGFKQAVFLLEKDTEDFQAMSANYENYNPLIPYFQLLFGICSVIISLFWFLHILIYVYPDPALAPFLNNYFQWFDTWFPLFGTLSVAIFVTYLLFCATKGAFKFGLRFMFLQIHPMKLGKTYMSSFMFNIGLVLLCALPAVQLAQDAFADYAAFSEIRQLFGVQVHNLKFFNWFFDNNVFISAMLGFMVLTSLYLACRPKDQSTNGQALRDRLRAHRAA